MSYRGATTLAEFEEKRQIRQDHFSALTRAKLIMFMKFKLRELKASSRLAKIGRGERLSA